MAGFVKSCDQTGKLCVLQEKLQGEEGWWWVREGVREGGRNDPNIVCIYD
jgi:hypothetical protein